MLAAKLSKMSISKVASSKLWIQDLNRYNKRYHVALTPKDIQSFGILNKKGDDEGEIYAGKSKEEESRTFKFGKSSDSISRIKKFPNFSLLIIISSRLMTVAEKIVHASLSSCIVADEKEVFNLKRHFFNDDDTIITMCEDACKIADSYAEDTYIAPFNLNTATVQQLKSVAAIGKVTAAKICKQGSVTSYTELGVTPYIVNQLKRCTYIDEPNVVSVKKVDKHDEHKRRHEEKFHAINGMTKDELMKIHKIGDKISNSIVTYLHSHKIRSLDELANINGVGGQRLKSIQQHFGE
ncbi:MAG: hypothetical protein Faunusvirus5_21 [Faunusvirus sp.]|jgi:DNA uptake protein ComE-like DNA-binding protein|uniref:Uncharacterized protein n=1 Tax=Faunusvirus sp. TaxID=2487766 RepID=A0A3G4ZWC2_9VIRU|nr:MAG: hypothetical protein Faunusvirus5_21 [Faunusvirus sp.]